VYLHNVLLKCHLWRYMKYLSGFLLNVTVSVKTLSYLSELLGLVKAGMSKVSHLISVLFCFLGLYII